MITGFMGCGKSRAARELAHRLNVPMVDLDEQITAHVGRSPAQLIVEDGEAAFRAVETEALRHVLQGGAARVIALGGGAWIQEMNRELVAQYDCLSVWLDVPFETCWARIEAAKEDRPLGRTMDQAFTLYQQRRPVYQLARLHIAAGDESCDEFVSRIASLHSLEHERR